MVHFNQTTNYFVLNVIVDEVKLLAVPVWRVSEWEGQSSGVTTVIALLLWDTSV